MTNFAMFLAAMTAYFSLSGSQMAAAHDGIYIEDAIIYRLNRNEPKASPSEKRSST